MVEPIQLTTLQSLEEAAGNQHAWWLEFDWNGRRELGMLAGFSQISGVPGLGGLADLFLFLVE